MSDSIAIIGVSFDLPNIKNWDDLAQSLSDSTSFISDMPGSRSKEIEKVFGKVQMAKAGYMKEIDQFDNEYFDFTERESLKCFPEHRLFLTHAMRAFYHAGYSEAALKGSKTGIFFTASSSAYYKYGSVADLSFGHVDFINGIEGTRLAKYLDTRGPVVAIDTSCSSSLVAINAARQSLNEDECEIAIVGGVKILTLTYDAAQKNVVHSKKEECRPFDQNADGMMNGEGAIFFVLKRYEQAVRDGDAILGEIRGVGINHGGGRISSLTAPSSEAQKEVLLEAWRKAKIDVNKIRYIEAHGTATILGDPIEIEGVKQAFYEAKSGADHARCGISSFKGQIGHLDYLSGLAGLLRLVAVLNFKIIPVQSNLSVLNKFFDLKHTGLYIPNRTEDWLAEDGERIGGLSSFGMTGTNVHFVVSQNDAHLVNTQPDKEIHYLQISHQDDEKIGRYKNYIRERVEAIDRLEDVHQLCSKLNRVFQVDKKNCGIIYASKATLIAALKAENTQGGTEKLFLLLDLELLSYSKEFIASLFEENAFIKGAWDKHVSLSPELIPHQNAVNVLFQYTLYKYLQDRTGKRLRFITPKGGSILNALIKSEITVSDVIDQAGNREPLNHDFDEESFKRYLQDNLSKEELIIIDFSGKAKNRFNNLDLRLNVIAGNFSDNDRFLLYASILETGVNPLKTNFNPFFNGIDLPYFNPKRFWPDVQVVAPVHQTAAKNTPVNDENISGIGQEEVVKIVRNSWELILETEDFSETDDFFELGGTSLAALDMIDELEKNIAGVKISYESIYSHSTIAQLTAVILSQLTVAPVQDQDKNTGKLSQAEIEKVIRDSWKLILETDDFDANDSFFEIGGTSLAALDMIDEIEKNLAGVKIPYEEIYSCSTIAKLSDRIWSQLGSSAVVENEIKRDFDSKSREERYDTLLSDIRKEHFSRHTPEHILVTGGTGLLGLNLLNYLINHTPARLYCLVRKEGQGSAEQRFWSVYEKYFEVMDKGRVTVFEGDLYQEGLGIKYPVEELSKIDMIFHIAGSPQFISSKGPDEHINFLGTKHIVDWANRQDIKLLNFISTVGVAGKTMPVEIENFYETDVNLGQQSGNLIHSSSKLKAEEYIQQHYNYKPRIFRIPNIGGRLDDGNFPTDLDKNLMWLRLKSLSEMKFYCEELLSRSSGIGLIPVDVLSELISEISFADINMLNVFHILQPKHFTNGEVLNSLEKNGIRLASTSYDNFMGYLNKNNYKMNFHQVAQKENDYKYRADATLEVISKLNLDKILNYDRQAYLDRLTGTNLKQTSPVNSLQIRGDDAF